MDFGSSSDEASDGGSNDSDGDDFTADRSYRGSRLGRQAARHATRSQTEATATTDVDRPHKSSNGDSGGLDEGDTQKTLRRSGRTGNSMTQSQASFASSMRVSQLPSQTQDESRVEDEISSGTASLALADNNPVEPERVAAFRAALGQLLNTDLFEDDSAPLAEVISAVNRRLTSREGGVFGREEAIKALKELEKMNHIM